MSAPTKSPITDKPLRNPGQSLEEARRKLFEDKIETPFLFALFFSLMAAMEWWRYYFKQPPSPIIFTICAVLLAGFTAWRFWKTRPQVHAIKQGIEGEKAVGQFLERLRESGYHVFHDLIGTGFNVDHVLIGPGGVFTIETKTWSKPLRGDPMIKFDGEQITVDGREPERDPVIQARAQAAWLKGLLAESTGCAYEVFPVVVFPGWFIKQGEGTLRNMWVLEPKALAKFLAKAPQRLALDEVKLASFHLSRFIRTSEQGRST
ncbi:nuclease-related domain-containing protein [Thiobacillus sp.]|uniref:nuclease-related domain-containing protein n=1 Tax=Thiobacillus sp. TaxID=924 RepID=UPI0025CD9CFE|nr:nuclease-related domain-containing protein [Thiobacillus sp.]MBT9539367.1 NERD domain-containing protein [Thiobacillus sp.]